MKKWHAAKAGDAFQGAIHDAVKSPIAEWRRPWWVRWVDEPTVEVDWDRKERFDGRKIMQVSWAQYVGKDKAAYLNKVRDKRVKEWMLENRPGYTLRDRALDIAGAQSGSVDTSFLGTWASSGEKVDPFRQGAFSPEEMGLPRWEGSPEENSRMIRVALRNFGADQVGFLKMDERVRKLIYANDARDGKVLAFENVERAYETSEKRVIPERAQWVIVFSVQLSGELIKRTNGSVPTALSSSTTGLAYARARNIMDRLQTFLHVIGYQGLMGTWFNGLGIAVGLGVMAGLGELSRLNRMISPEYGPMQRVFRIVTDLPLAPTKPIDAGIMRFCRTCKKCAEACPASCLSMETDPSWEVAGPWNSPGHRAYFEYSPRCRSYWALSTVGCARCFAACPFSRDDRSFIHSFVAATLSRTPVFNGLFTRLHTLAGYNVPKEPESWWDIKDMPPFGIDSTKGTRFD